MEKFKKILVRYLPKQVVLQLMILPEVILKKLLDLKMTLRMIFYHKHLSRI